MRKRILLTLAFAVAIFGAVNFVSAQQLPGDSIGAAPGPSITFSASPNDISIGDSARLTWDAPTADACQEPGGWLFNDPKSGSKVVSPSSTTEYEVNCRNSKGTRTAYITVRVERCLSNSTCHGETIDVKVNGSDGPVTIIGLPTTLNITVNITSADAWWALLSPDPSVCVDWNSSTFIWGTGLIVKTTIPDSPENYGLRIFPASCQFDISSDRIRDSVDVNIKQKGTTPPPPPPGPGPGPAPTPGPVVGLVANPAVISQGQSATLGWGADNVTTCTASASPSNSNWSGSITPVGGGSRTVTPSQTTTFTLSCSGSGGSASKSAQITVIPPSAPPPGPGCVPKVDIKVQ